jgi:hypothetical protein
MAYTDDDHAREAILKLIEAVSRIRTYFEFENTDEETGIDDLLDAARRHAENIEKPRGRTVHDPATGIA